MATETTWQRRNPLGAHARTHTPTQISQSSESAILCMWEWQNERAVRKPVYVFRAFRNHSRKNTLTFRVTFLPGKKGIQPLSSSFNFLMCVCPILVASDKEEVALSGQTGETKRSSYLFVFLPGKGKSSLQILTALLCSQLHKILLPFTIAWQESK